METVEIDARMNDPHRAGRSQHRRRRSRVGHRERGKARRAAQHPLPDTGPDDVDEIERHRCPRQATCQRRLEMRRQRERVHHVVAPRDRGEATCVVDDGRRHLGQRCTHSGVSTNRPPGVRGDNAGRVRRWGSSRLRHSSANGESPVVPRVRSMPRSPQAVELVQQVDLGAPDRRRRRHEQRVDGVVHGQFLLPAASPTVTVVLSSEGPLRTTVAEARGRPGQDTFKSRSLPCRRSSRDLG